MTQKKFLGPYLHFDNLLQDQHNGLCKLVGLVRLVKRRNMDEQSPTRAAVESPRGEKGRRTMNQFLNACQVSNL